MSPRFIFNYINKILFNKKQKCACQFDSKLVETPCKPQKIAGIVGWINEKSRIEFLINKALNDGMNKVLIFACLENPLLYYQNIEPLIKENPEQILYAGCVKNRQLLFDSISDLYIFSNSTISNSIRQECDLTRTKYHEI